MVVLMKSVTEQSRAVLIGRKKYVITSDDDYLSNMGAEFEPQTTALLSALFGPNSTILDVGANIGCTSILFGEIARQVVSFEPSPTTFAFLRQNVERAGLRNVDLRNLALGSETATSRLTFAPSNRGGGFVSDKTIASEGHVIEEVKVRRLDDVASDLTLKTLDLIKLDVEGFERRVLEGGTSTLKRFRPVAAIELNHWCLNALQRTCVPDFLDYLCSIFPFLAAVEGNKYLDVHDPAERYVVMYHHIIHFRYVNLIGAFSTDQLPNFLERYVHSA
jgi:FkbM family methyltransferase